MFMAVCQMLQRRAAVVPVTVTSRSPGVEVHEFLDAELSCEFRTENDKNPRIEWKKIDKDVSFVYYDGHFIGPFHGRAEIKGATVRLHRVTQTDAGKYRCEVSAPQDTITLGETNVTLTVLVPPHTPSCDVPSSALTGSLVQLRCRDRHSIPAAVYTWFKDNRALPIQLPNATYTIDEKTGVLTFQKVSRADAGQYYCEARNGVGPGKSCSGTRMQIDDLNEAALISGVLLLALLLFLGALGGVCAHRHGLFSRHRGRSFWIPQCHGAAHISSQNLHRTEHIQNSGYSHPPKEPQDFKHTQSFML
ncbi:junctional adhesion molecule B-like isoform X3 [Sinocyclocheilus grahami]|uniref:junctional adhesion molecule B-like isoform X2 n=1 Tax=Sinocyclocheilus grahami TaxID=75366 RepID=UPI0007AD31EA|nr:PREDICTED: junctional adhesion molecule B-like isoform X2 [Sinocyclocheilus grahami]XP_016139081.1 PREDICTED: junctional adhesion molecule B-like isoform X3 [Sinocyclocheilus grahami]